MTTLSKIAILAGQDSNLTFELEEIQGFFKTQDIESRIFYESDSILEYKPDCVIVTSPQDAKLTPYPTYGLIRTPSDECLQVPRFLRNILTYDGYFTVSPKLKQMLGDLMFGARKQGTSICELDFFPVATEFHAPSIDVPSTRVIIFEPDFNNSRYKNAIYRLLSQSKNIFVATFSIAEMDKYSDRFIVTQSVSELENIINKNAVAVCLDSGDEQQQTYNSAVLKLISSCAITIAHRTKLLESHFGDNLYYIPADTSVDVLYKTILSHLEQIKQKPEEAINKCKMAHQVFLRSFAFNNFFQRFVEFHQKTLVAKGYVPHPDPFVEKSWPSVTYIIRTGGKHRKFLERTLDCLVAQRYPDLRAILVIHAHFPYIDEIIQKYSSLKIKVIESIKSRRSEAIRDGMAAVETDLFGLFDDDDEIFPNHVRMLVKTLQYHSNRDWRGEVGMVYSGSIHADDTHSVFERVEFQDHKLIHKNEKRAIEHFKFYSSVLMSQHAWFMPNGWLARTKLIDNELLVDPVLDTCEDLYFELQLAQKAHFAFSVEVTAIHHFHHFGNSTIDDSYKHLPDTQRIALRNFSRVFPPDILYDTNLYNLVGRVPPCDQKQIAYQDYLSLNEKNDYFNNNPFYPARNKLHAGGAVMMGNIVLNASNQKFRMTLSPIRWIKYVMKFVNMDKYKKTYYLNQFKLNLQKHGYSTTIKKVFVYFSRQ